LEGGLEGGLNGFSVMEISLGLKGKPAGVKLGHRVLHFGFVKKQNGLKVSCCRSLTDRAQQAVNFVRLLYVV